LALKELAVLALKDIGLELMTPVRCMPIPDQRICFLLCTKQNSLQRTDCRLNMSLVALQLDFLNLLRCLYFLNRRFLRIFSPVH
jgi:hypothetical protein